MEQKRRMVAGRTGQYELLARLHVSSLAKHHLAINREAKPEERYVVIKETLDGVIDDKIRTKLFLDEIRVTSKFEHPNLVKTLETGRTKSRYFAISEYLYGESLAFLLNKTVEAGKEMPINLAAYIMARVCDGLHHAHQLKDKNDLPLNILHLNINPKNIFVLYSGEIKLAGFDITRTAFKIVDGFSKGDVAYISPEQSNREELDVTSDVFSLGIVFWEMLAQRALYVRSSQIDTLRAIKSGEVPMISEFRPYVSGELAAIATRALQTNRKSRYPSAGKMGAELWKYLEDETHKTSAQGVKEYCEWLLAGRIHYKQSLLDKLAQEDLEPKTANMLRPDTQASLPVPEQVRTPTKPDLEGAGPPPLPPLPKKDEKPKEPEEPTEAEQPPAHEETIPVLNVAKFKPEKRAVPAQEPAPPVSEEEPPPKGPQRPTIQISPEEQKDLVAETVPEPKEPEEQPAVEEPPVFEEPPAPPEVPEEAEELAQPEEPAQPEEDQAAPLDDDEDEGDFRRDTAEIPIDQLPKVVPEFFDEEEETSEAAKPQIRISRHGKKDKPAKSGFPMVLVVLVLVAAAAVITVLAWPDKDAPRDPNGTQDKVPDKAATDPVDIPKPDAGSQAVAKAPADARLTITSTPDGCPVRLDSVLLEGKTPIRDLAIKPDQEHLVAVFCPKHKLQAKKAKGAPGEKITLEFQPTLLPSGGTLELNTVPWTNVFLGKKKLGITPILGAKLPAGVHQLRLENKDAGISTTVSVTIQAGKKTSLTKRFK